MIHLVSYDLNKHERPSAYDDVKTALDDNSTSMIRALYSQWLVETDLTASQLRDALKVVMDSDDRLMIVPIDKNTQYSGWLAKDRWAWLTERL